MAYFPKKLLIGLTSRCNLKCQHCSRSHLDMAPNDGTMMSRETLDSIISDFFPHISAIYLGGTDLGEQMASPHFNHFIQEVGKYPNIDLELVTNLTLLDEKKAKLLADSASVVCISVEGSGAEYEKIRGRKWADLARRVKMLDEARSRVQRERPLKICFDVTVLRGNEQTHFELLEESKRLHIDQLSYRHYVPHSPKDARKSLLLYKTESDAFFAKINQRAQELSLACILPPPFSSHHGLENIRNACSQPWEVIGVHSDGTLFTCCYDITVGKYEPGHDAVMRVWNNDRYQFLRATVNTTSPISPCDSCEMVCANSNFMSAAIRERLRRHSRENLQRRIGKMKHAVATRLPPRVKTFIKEHFL